MSAVSTAEDFRAWALMDAHGRSPIYERLAIAISEDDRVTTLLQLVSSKQRKPPLLFGVLRLHGVPVDRPDVAIEWIVDHPQLVLSELRTRRNQTNEVRRAAALMPAVASVAEGRDIALIELGASAGLLLLLDKYHYVYATSAGEREVGDPSSPVTLTTAVRGQVPIPTEVPRLGGRIGIDLQPVNPRETSQRKWLEALVWPEHVSRRERLTAALGVAALDPPKILHTDIEAGLRTLLERVPVGMTPVVMHALTMHYVSEDKQAAVIQMCRHAQVPRIGLESSTDPDASHLELTIDLGQPRTVAHVQIHGEWIEGVS